MPKLTVVRKSTNRKTEAVDSTGASLQSPTGGVPQPSPTLPSASQRSHHVNSSATTTTVALGSESKRKRKSNENEKLSTKKQKDSVAASYQTTPCLNCKVTNCPNKGQSCAFHGKRQKLCAHPDCTDPATNKYCPNHGAKRKRCTHEGCTQPNGRCVSCSWISSVHLK